MSIPGRLPGLPSLPLYYRWPGSLRAATTVPNRSPWDAETPQPCPSALSGLDFVLFCSASERLCAEILDRKAFRFEPRKGPRHTYSESRRGSDFDRPLMLFSVISVPP